MELRISGENELGHMFLAFFGPSNLFKQTIEGPKNKILETLCSTELGTSAARVVPYFIKGGR